MSEQHKTEDYDKQMADGADHTVEMMQGSINALLTTADVESVYGKPLEKDGTVIIPAAEVLSVMGVAVGYGNGSAYEDDKGGGGGGGRAFSRPVAVIIASNQGVRVEPVIDITKIALAGLTTAAFMMGMIMRFINPKKTIKEMQKGNLS